MRSLVAVMLPLLTLPVVTLALAGCPEPLPSENVWVPVANVGPPKTQDPEVLSQHERVRQIAMEARVKKMRAAFIADDEATCTSDGDCELTAHHCCNCSAGGQMAAANKEALPEVLRRRGIVCGDYSCPQVVSDDPTCAAERAVCREGRCVPDVPGSAPPPVEGIGVEPIPEAP